MAVMLVSFVYLGAFFTLAAICEKVMPDKVCDKLLMFFGVDEGGDQE